jgi:hypothetical protein
MTTGILEWSSRRNSNLRRSPATTDVLTRERPAWPHSVAYDQRDWRWHDVHMPSTEYTPEVRVEPTQLPAGLIERAEALNAGVVVLPLDDSGPKALYSEPSVMLVKQLRALGADAEFAHPPQDRVFEVKKGAEIIVDLVIGIAAAASWEVLRSYLLRSMDKKARLSISYLELEDENRRGKTWTIDGDPSGVVDAIDALRRDPPNDNTS